MPAKELAFPRTSWVNEQDGRELKKAFMLTGFLREAKKLATKPWREGLVVVKPNLIGFSDPSSTSMLV